jgi:hypothetical protein
MFSVISANLNIGLRHVLPVYPLMYIAAAILITLALRRWTKPIMIAVACLAGMLVAETLLSWPNYIAYFNFAVGGTKSGVKLLGDSNLDWGQDLPLLAKWQREHPGVKLAFGPWTRLDGPEGAPLGVTYSGSYFGTVDPKFYGINADPLYAALPNDPNLYKTHVLAVSATYIQGIYGGPFAPAFKDITPTEVLGGTIYLYDLRNATVPPKLP